MTIRTQKKFWNRFGLSVRWFLVLTALGYLTGCGAPPPSPPTPEPGVTDVSMQGLAFAPSDVTINQGESVRWTNNESLGIDHTVTSGNPGDPDAGALFDSGIIQPGESYILQFNAPGTYVYFCAVHPLIMRNATITVLPSP